MTTPGQGIPANLDYVYQITDMSDSDDHSPSGIEQALGVPINDSWTRANSVHQSTVVGRFVEVEEELIQSGAVLGNHENRITKLESGITVAEIFSNDIWTKPMFDPGNGDPPEPYTKHEFIGIAGAGGGRCPQPSAIGDRNGGQGGGQGGYGSEEFSDVNVEATVNVVIGTGGPGGDQANENGHNGTHTTFADSGGIFFQCGRGIGGINSTTPAVPGTGNFPEWNASGGNGASITGASMVGGTSGGPGYLAAAGTGGGTNGGVAGQNGGACPAGRIGPGGGGGGGGFDARGGHGGFPGGGGGGGGTHENWAGGAVGRGGNGAGGRAIIISSPFA